MRILEGNPKNRRLKTVIRLLTEDGAFLTGDSLELVAQLGARTRVLAGQCPCGLMQAECDRILRYQHDVGSQFARFAALRLLDSLEEEGFVLIQR